MKLGKLEQNSLKTHIPQDIKAAMQKITESVALHNVSDMSLEEINDEINAAHKGQ